MPVEEDYSRRQILPQHVAPTSPPINHPQCASGCLPTPQERYGVVDPHADARYAERFGSERSQSDRLPSGERYQGVSERYPLGERPQTSISSDRLVQNTAQNSQVDRYQYQRYPERYTPIGSLERYHQNAERYSRTNTPTERYHTLSNDKERYTPTERYHTLSNEKEIYAPTERYRPNEKERSNITNNDRYTQNEGYSDRQASAATSIERYTPTDRHRNDKLREHSSSGERKDRYQQQYQNHYDQYVPERHQAERFPTIPCPERFATQERIPFNQVPDLEPPSPAPASDRFIPPPPLSPENTPTTPDCFTNNAFPSPTTTVPPPERFMPPPPLTASPTETFTSKKLERRYQYATSPNPNDRYHQDQRYKDRNQMYNNDRFQNTEQSYHQSSDKFVSSNERFNGERYVPQNPHMPVERYVPQPQPDNYYGSYQYDRYSVKFNPNDPYMRRDLAAFHYRFPLPYPQNQYQRVRYLTTTPSRVKCCQYSDQGYQLSKSSPASSSSSSVTSQSKDLHKEVSCVNVSLQEIQCQNYHTNYHQEKGTQCTSLCQQGSKECVSFVSPNLRVGKVQCRHSICASPSVEYMGASGGRHVCATPPPRTNVCSQDSTICNDNCCGRRSQNSLTVAVW